MKKFILRPIIHPIGPGIAYVQLTRDQLALIDSVDAERVGKHNWQAYWSENTASFYAVSSMRRQGKKRETLRLHRLILQPRPGLFGDHINGNTLDNRGSNLREVTLNQNGYNRRMHRNNSTGFKGVYARGNKYVANIRVNGKLVHMGTYHTAEAAHEARKNAASIHHGEFARTA